MSFLSFFRSKPSAPQRALSKLRADSYVNEVTGYGTSRDKRMGGSFFFAPLTPQALSNMYYDDDISETIVDSIPEEMFRRGYEIEDEDTEDDPPADGEGLTTLDVDDKFTEALKLSRLYGGAAIILGFRGQKFDTPLPDGGGNLVFLQVHDSRYVRVASFYTDLNSPKFGEPEFYNVSKPSDGAGAKYERVHESRVIPFIGAPVDSAIRPKFQGFGMSCLQRPANVITDFLNGYAAAGNLLADAAQGVFSIRGLLDAIAAGEEQAIKTRLQMLDRHRSASRSIVLDSEDETFTRVATPFAGVPEMLDKLMLRLSAATHIPVSILMGRSPSGLNATGDVDIRSWYDQISKKQKTIKPKLERVLSFVRNKDTKIEWCPLWEPTDKEKEETEKLRADKWGVYIDKGVLQPEQVAIAEFGSGELEIDEEALKASMKAELENPTPPPMVPGEPVPGQDPNAPPTDPSAPPAAKAPPVPGEAKAA